MKKLYCALLALLLALSLCACTAQDAQDAAVLLGEAAAALSEQAPPLSDARPQTEPAIDRDGAYTAAQDVAAYIWQFGCLPGNFMTKDEARALGWEGGSLESYAPGMCIGGDRFGNYEGLLPDGSYTECDVDTLGADSRGAKRLVFSADAIFYTEDHYESFTLLYGG